MADGQPIPASTHLSPAQRVLRAYHIAAAAEDELSHSDQGSGLSLLAHAVVVSLFMKFGPDKAAAVIAAAQESALRATALGQGGA